MRVESENSSVAKSTYEDGGFPSTGAKIWLRQRCNTVLLCQPMHDVVLQGLGIIAQNPLPVKRKNYGSEPRFRRAKKTAGQMKIVKLDSFSTWFYAGSHTTK